MLPPMLHEPLRSEHTPTRARQQGASLIELAIALPLLLGLGFLLLDAARWHWTRQLAHQALLDAARTGAVLGVDALAIERRWQEGLAGLSRAPTQAQWSLITPSLSSVQNIARPINHGPFRGELGLDPAWMADRSARSPLGVERYQQAHTLELVGSVSFKALTPGVATVLKSLAEAHAASDPRHVAWSRGEWLIALRVSAPLQAPAPLRHLQAALEREHGGLNPMAQEPGSTHLPVGALIEQGPANRAWWLTGIPEDPSHTPSAIEDARGPGGLPQGHSNGPTGSSSDNLPSKSGSDSGSGSMSSEPGSGGSTSVPRGADPVGSSNPTSATSPTNPECGVTLCCEPVP